MISESPGSAPDGGKTAAYDNGRRHRGPVQRQEGAFNIFLALSLAVLIGITGLAIDVGRGWAIRSELQNSADACALAGAYALNNTSEGLRMADGVGRYAAQLNKVGFQQTTLAASDISVGFSITVNTAPNPLASADAMSRFITCDIKQDNLATALMGVLGFDQITRIAATAKASVVKAQNVCSIPLALCGDMTKPGDPVNHPEGVYYGLMPGDEVKLDPSGSTLYAIPGYFRWVNPYGYNQTATLEDGTVFSGGDNNLSTFANMLAGSDQCGIDLLKATCLRFATGSKSSLADSWNSRFGVYKTGAAAYTVATAPPDRVGVGYALGYKNAAADYLNNLNNETGMRFVETVTKTSDKLSGYGDYHSTATGTPYRRLVVVPIINCKTENTCGDGAKTVVRLGWACALMKGPTDVSGTGKPWGDFRLEYLGPAQNSNSYCRTIGLPGDSIGSNDAPLVPVLVR